MKVALLLGAGASVDYFSGTEKITEELKQLTFEAEGAYFTKKMFINGKPYFTALSEVLQRIELGSSISFEELLFTVEQIELWARDEEEKTKDEKLLPRRMLLAPFLEINANRKPFFDIDASRMARCCGEDRILELLSKPIEGQEELNKVALNQFFKETLSNNGHQISLFSLNYDILPLYSGIAFETGFKSTPDSTVEHFVPLEFLTSTKKHIYCQLHGSVLFATDREKRVCRFSDVAAAIEFRKKNLGARYRPNQDGSFTRNAQIITGLRKADAILFDPYASYFDKLFSEMIATPNWLIVGYSGRDACVNEILERAKVIWNERHQQTKIVWIDKASEKLFLPGQKSSKGLFQDVSPYFSSNQRKSLEAVLPRDCSKLFADSVTSGNYANILPEKQKLIELIGERCSALISFLGVDETLRTFHQDIFDFWNVDKHIKP